jgi:MoaE-MoaD fusion protein
MRITVKLFAVLRENAGAAEASLDLPADATVADAAEAIGRKFPAIAASLGKIAFAVNQDYATPKRTLVEGDELALIPAVSGGATDPTSWLEVLDKPLSVSAATAFVTDPSAGGLAIFIGSTRSQKSNDTRSLVALDYEAYADMAVRQFADFDREARQRWPVVKLVVLHRVGRVPVAEPSVLIAVSTPHRSEAFEVCRWLIDTLKSQATIWKKEIWSDGETTWVGQTDP